MTVTRSGKRTKQAPQKKRRVVNDGPKTRSPAKEAPATHTPKKQMAGEAYPTPPASRRTRSPSVETPTKRRRTPARTQMLATAPSLDSEDSEDEMDTLSARKAKKARREPPTPASTPSRHASESTLEPEVHFIVPSMSDDEGAAELKEPAAVVLPPTPQKTPTSKAKRKHVVIPLAKEVSSDEEEEEAGDENKPLVPDREYGQVDEELEPHQTRFPSKNGLHLLKQVLDVVYSRTPPPTLLSEAASTRAELAAIPCLPCLGEWELDVRLQLDRTIRDGEGNCMALLGPKGVGKSAMIDRSLELLREAHGDDAFITIRLSALTTPTDRLTLREIARQLCSDEGGVDDDGASFTSHAVILQSLLSLLEPAATANTSVDRSKPLVFVLDDFDRFAERDARQSFLYCLLDIVQSKRRKGGMAVVGVSSRVDCLDRLEKRVRSRCQSRVLRVLPPATLADFTSIARTALIRQEDDSELVEAWNAGVESFLASDETQRAFRDLFDLRACSGELLQNVGSMLQKYAFAVSSGRTFALPCLDAADLPISLSSPERFQLSSLPAISLCVLIAAKHVTASSTKPFFTPAALYDRYYCHARSEAASKQRPFTLAAFTRALEQLCAAEAIVDAGPTSATGTVSASAAAQATSSYRRLRTVIWPSELDAMVKSRKDMAVHLKQWCVHG